MTIEAKDGLHAYAFDIKLAAVVRVTAVDEATALAAIERHLDAADLMVAFKDRDASVVVTEASVYIDDVAGPLLFEIDGEEVD